MKVRLLVDDMDARGKNYQFAALDAHPNIEVRMFNPFGSRTGSLQFAFEAMGSFSRINRRMHNKTWIADNRIAIVGGRNLGNEYFGASDEVNFVDLDFAMVGPIVRDASASFDRYWNSRRRTHGTAGARGRHDGGARCAAQVRRVADGKRGTIVCS